MTTARRRDLRVDDVRHRTPDPTSVCRRSVPAHEDARPTRTAITSAMRAPNQPTRRVPRPMATVTRTGDERDDEVAAEEVVVADDGRQERRQEEKRDDREHDIHRTVTARARSSPRRKRDREPPARPRRRGHQALERLRGSEQDRASRLAESETDREVRDPVLVLALLCDRESPSGIPVTTSGMHPMKNLRRSSCVAARRGAEPERFRSDRRAAK